MYKSNDFPVINVSLDAIFLVHIEYPKILPTFFPLLSRLLLPSRGKIYSEKTDKIY